MSQLTIYQDNYADATVVSNLFIDEYMRDANDAQLKIYLYLIRMVSAHLPTSISDMADKFNHTEKDVLRALKYWEKNKLLTLDYDDSHNITGIHLLEPGKKRQAGDIPAAPVVSLISRVSDIGRTAPQEAEAIDPYEKPSYSPDQLKAFKSNEETAQLLFITEQYMGKTLSPSEVRTILYLSDKLGFSSDLIDYLIQYCVERGKKDFRYIEKVALSWAQAGITTPKQAARAAHKYDKNVYEIMKALGKTSSPTAREAEYINHWVKDLGFAMDILLEACERTVLATDKHRFEYADSILNSWHKEGVRRREDIARADETFRKARGSAAAQKQSPNKFNQFMQNDYDFDTLEKELLNH